VVIRFDGMPADLRGDGILDKDWRLSLVTSISETWGTQPEERELAFPCDDMIPEPENVLYRGVTINASPATVFRWLCQMRVAPYSYDWIDNGGRQSPAKLTPGLENVSVGQDVMRIFTLVGFERDQQLTLRLKARASQTFGNIAVSYMVIPIADDHLSRGCRLLVKLIVKNPPGLYGRIMRTVLPWGDLIMMRRQLLNLKRLAEEKEQRGTG
jgi:hypothetical protein